MITKQDYEKWMDLLEGGTLEQGHNQLRQDLGGSWGYCCIGVFAKVVNDDHWHKDRPEYWCVTEKALNIPYDPINNENWDSMEEDEVCFEYVPYDVLDQNLQHLLAHFNDDLEWSFPKIAKWLREHHYAKEGGTIGFRWQSPFQDVRYEC